MLLTAYACAKRAHHSLVSASICPIHTVVHRPMNMNRIIVPCDESKAKLPYDRLDGKLFRQRKALIKSYKVVISRRRIPIQQQCCVAFQRVFCPRDDYLSISTEYSDSFAHHRNPACTCRSLHTYHEPEKVWWRSSSPVVITTAARRLHTASIASAASSTSSTSSHSYLVHINSES